VNTAPTRPSRRAVSFLGVVIALAVAAAGCGDEEPGDGGQELANPAAVFCEEQGGEAELDTGLCLLADGSSVDQWEYYRANAENPSGSPT